MMDSGSQQNVLVLYSVFTGYNAAAFDEFAKKLSGTVDIVVWPDRLHTQNYAFTANDKLTFVSRENFTFLSFLKIFSAKKPKLVFLSGWMDRLYLACAICARLSGAKVVLGFDTHWKGTTKQALFSGLFRLIGRLFFSHAFVPGQNQKLYALKLGIPPTKVATGAYTCDTRMFRPKNDYKKNKAILFIGRLEHVKGVDLLIDSLQKIVAECLDLADWKLLLAGSGTLTGTFGRYSNVIEMGFLSPTDLNALAEKVDFFCLPSRDEPWGLVVHEAAACGLPMLLSDKCGAKEDFLLNGANGFTFNSEDTYSLIENLKKMMRMSEDDLKRMGRVSAQLSIKNSPLKWSDKMLKIMQD